MTDIRRLLLIVEDTEREAGRPVAPPVRRAAAVAVIGNPYAGRYEDDLSALVETGEALGRLLGERAAAALGRAPESYGKAAIMGAAGELEHAAAILHPKLGAPLRSALGGGAALVPSAKKRAGPGASIDVPLGHKDAAYVRSHFDAMEVLVPGAPLADEIVVVVVVTDGGRPLPRIGGLTADAIEGRDGLR